MKFSSRRKTVRVVSEALLSGYSHFTEKNKSYNR